MMLITWVLLVIVRPSASVVSAASGSASVDISTQESAASIDVSTPGSASMAVTTPDSSHTSNTFTTCGGNVTIEDFWSVVDRRYYVKRPRGKRPEDCIWYVMITSLIERAGVQIRMLSLNIAESLVDTCRRYLMVLQGVPQEMINKTICHNSASKHFYIESSPLVVWLYNDGLGYNTLFTFVNKPHEVYNPEFTTPNTVNNNQEFATLDTDAYQCSNELQSCYRAVPFGQTAAGSNDDLTRPTYSNAEQLCAQDGAHLATITSQIEDDNIQSIVRARLPSTHVHFENFRKEYYIGLKMNNNNNNSMEGAHQTAGWVWITEEEYEYNNMKDYNLIPATENCVVVTHYFKWKVITCDYGVHGYVCERPLHVDRECEASWYGPNGTQSCYLHKLFAVLQKASYTLAANICSAYGAHLATLTSAKEVYFLNEQMLSLLKRLKYYIGLRRTQTNGWSWITGETEFANNWMPGEPTDHDCAYIEGLLMGATECDGSGANIFGFICEQTRLGKHLSVADVIGSTMKTNDHGDGVSDNMSVSVQDKYDATTTANDTETDVLHMALYVTIPTLAVVVLVITCILWRMHGRKSMSRDKSSDGPQLSAILKTLLDEDSKIKLQTLLLPRDALDIEQLLGKGAFGNVYRGSYSTGQCVQTVAIKTLKASCIGSDIVGFVNEAVTMSEFDHVHILSIIGVCIRKEDGVPILVLPYMVNGDLKAYLTQFNFNKPELQVPDERQLLLFCLHIARGMEYLAEQKFIHRDLAARNCTVSSSLVVKIADFGLSRDIYTSMYYRQDQQKLLPIKWMALEILQFQTFTFETDVWSFGVTMWEILSLGMGPYPELDNASVMKHLKSGHRLEKPDACSENMYQLMSSCWAENPELRPTFTDISNTLSNYLADMFNYFELNAGVECEIESLPNDARTMDSNKNLDTQMHNSPEASEQTLDLSKHGSVRIDYLSEHTAGKDLSKDTEARDSTSHCDEQIEETFE